MVLVEVPKNMINSYISWHSKRPEEGGTTIPQGHFGSGEEFLNWNRQFIAKYKRWCKQYDKPFVLPWYKVPPELMQITDGINTLKSKSFGTLDDLGIFLEKWARMLHDGAAKIYNEPVLKTLESPRSSYFWQMYGLINTWRKDWLKNKPNTFNQYVML
jgi:hypothetical protein